MQTSFSLHIASQFTLNNYQMKIIQTALHITYCVHIMRSNHKNASFCVCTFPPLFFVYLSTQCWGIGEFLMIKLRHRLFGMGQF